MANLQRMLATISESRVVKARAASTTYELTLSCGCRFWEDRASGMEPVVGETVGCYSPHNSGPADVPTRPMRSATKFS